MAIVTRYSTAFQDPANLVAIDAVFAEGNDKVISALIPVVNGDSIASTYFVGRVPSSALISPRSNIFATANAGLTAVSLGFQNAPNALVNAANIAAGGTFPALSAVTIPNYSKRAWQLAGLASDPGGMLTIIMTLGAAATVDSTIFAAIDLIKSL